MGRRVRASARLEEAQCAGSDAVSGRSRAQEWLVLAALRTRVSRRDGETDMREWLNRAVCGLALMRTSLRMTANLLPRDGHLQVVLVPRLATERRTAHAL